MVANALPTPQQVGGSPSDLRRRLAMQMLLQGGSTEPVQHWTQGAARVAQGIMGGIELGAIDRDRRQGNEMLADFLIRRGGGTPAAAPQTAPEAAPAAAAPQAAPIQHAPPQVPASVATAEWSPNSGGNLIPPALIRSESGGRFDAQNAAVGAGGQVGHFGRLQFGRARLADAQRAGVIPPGTTPQQFMADPEMQQRVEQWHFQDIDQQIQRRGLSRAIGTQIGGTPVTPEGMRAVAHLGGVGGLERFINTGGRHDPADVNGTRLSMYLAQNVPSGPPGPQAQGGPAPAPAQGPAAAPAGPAARPGALAGMDRATLIRMLNNEATAPFIQQAIAAEMAPTGLQLVQREDGTFVFDPRRGSLTQVGPSAPRAPVAVPNNSRLYDATNQRVLLEADADPVVVPPGSSIVDRQALRRGQASPAPGAGQPPPGGAPAPGGRPGVLFQGQGFRPVTDPAERRSMGIQDTDRRAYQIGPDGRLQAVQDTPNTQVTTSVNTATNPLVEGYSRQFTEQRERAAAAADTIRTLHQARAQLDEPGGVISGAFAQGRLDAARVGALFGITDERVITNTESFRAAIGQSVLSSIRALGTNPSNTDREYIERVAAGNIALGEQSIRRVLDIQERYARQAIERYNQTFGQVSDELGRVQGADPAGLAIMRALGRVGMPEEYARPTAPAVAPPGQQPPGQPAPQATPPPANLPRPTTRQEMEALPPRTPFIAPDGSIRVRP